LFDWSIPFIADRVCEMFENLMDQNTWYQEERNDTVADLEDDLGAFPPMLLKKKSSSVDYAKVMKRLNKEQI